MLFESHGHYSRYNYDQTFRFLSVQDDEYCIKEGCREDVIAEMRDSGVVGILEASVDLASNPKMLDYAFKSNGYVFSAVGTHPTRTGSTKWHDRKKIQEMIEQYSDIVVAIGETGLDFHQSRGEQHRFRQLCWFIYQINLADKYKLPLVLHVREAHNEALCVLKLLRHKLHGGVVHCFCSTEEIAEQYIALGFYLGIGGALLQNDRAELQDAVTHCPIDHILIETDAPFVLPDFDCDLSRKKRRKIRNSSMILPKIVQKISELKNMDVQETEEVVFSNTFNAFPLISMNKE